MKAVIVLDPDQPLGLLVNTASVLAVTLGDLVESIRGADTYDADGILHPGVIRIPLPILAADSQTLQSIYERARSDEAITVADFTRTAQSCKTYEEYESKCAETPTEAMGLLGVALYGDRKRINKLVGNLKMLR